MPTWTAALFCSFFLFPHKRITRNLDLIAMTNMGNQKFEFFPEERLFVRNHLLKWYQSNKRDLPWRRSKNEIKDQNELAYNVWVSEIMLQQTKVKTVISYFNRWIEKWPTVENLSRSSQEEVNEMWSGLGYYSRGKRLREGAIKVMEKLAGVLPQNAKLLQSEIPGIGRYTACAIASIVFNEATGLVDGNVIRVMTRLRAIGGNVTNKNVIDHIWKLANNIVDQSNPGDFNQAVMELGATICHPKNPQCNKCPLKEICTAHKQVVQYNENNEKSLQQKNFKVKMELEAPDIEDLYKHLKFGDGETWEPKLGVTNYPRKSKIKWKKTQKCSVLYASFIDNSNECFVLLKKRPTTGLLAGLWEFPTSLANKLQDENLENLQINTILKSHSKIISQKNDEHLKILKGSVIHKRQFAGSLPHVFSHINMIYMVETVVLEQSKLNDLPDDYRWVNKKNISSIAVSVSVLKILDLITRKGIKRKKSNTHMNKEKVKRQRNTIENYFSMK